MSTIKPYFDRIFNLNAVKILPGDYYATNEGMLMVTVLGSCVSVCLLDEKAKVFGMNHFLLPTNDAEPNDSLSQSARYGAHAMELLINQMLKLGAQKKRLKAKVFGGGSVLKNMVSNNIGERNVNFTLAFLQAEGIPVVGKDLLGDLPRKIYFFPETGEVKMKKIRSLHNSTIITREQDYQESLVKQSSDDISLFD